MAKRKAPVVTLVPKAPPAPAWSAVEMLEEILGRIKAGEIKPTGIMVFYLHQLENGNRQPETWLQNIGIEERIAFCELEKARALEQWKS